MKMNYQNDCPNTQNLTYTNERLKVILTHLSDITFIMNEYDEILEYYPSANFLIEEEIIGKKLKDISSLAETLTGIRNAIAEATQTKRKATFEYCFDSLEEKKWFKIVVSIISWDNENPKEIICLFNNISKKKQMELALKESEERFRLAIQATKDGLWEWNIQTGEEFFSPRWCEIVGYEENEVVRNLEFWHSRIHPEDREKVKQSIDNHLNHGEIYDVEYRHLHKSGQYFWQKSRGQSVLDENGKPCKMVGFISDISKSKEAEIKLTQLSALYEKLLENVPGYVVCRDYSGKFLFVNNGFAALFGKKPEEVVGLTDEAYGATREEIINYLKNDKKVIDSGQPLFIEEEVVLRKDGSRGLFQVTKVPLNLNGSNAVLSVATDVTTLKMTEKALIESEQKLLQKSKILSAIAKMTENLLVSRNVKATLKESFELIGTSTEVDRVYFFERDLDTNLVNFKVEWTAPDVSKELNNPKLHNMNERNLGEYMPPLLQNKPYQNIVRNIRTPEIKQRLEEQGTLSILLLPIFVKNIFYGFIGFDDCKRERIWSEDELNTFQSLATNISNSIERIHNESVIKESENNFRQINETIEDVFWLYDVVNRKYIYMSPACEKVLEVKQEHFYTNTHTQNCNIFEEDKYKFQHAEDILKHKDSYEIEYRIITQDGRVKWINEKSFAIRDENGKFIRNSGICSDITEKKRIQAEKEEVKTKLAAERHLLRAIIDNAPINIYVKDLEGRKILANKSEYEFVGAKCEEEVLGKNDFELYDTDIANQTLQEDLKVINENRPILAREAIIRTKDNTNRWILSSKIPLLNEGKQVIGLVGISLDITERKQIEAEKQIDLEVEKVVNMFAQNIYQQNSIDGLLHEVTRDCVSYLNFEDSVIYLLDESGTKLVQKAAHNAQKPIGEEVIINRFKIELGEGIVGSVALSAVAEIVDDTSLDSRYIVEDLRRYSEIALPIIFNGKVIGVIDSEHSEKHFYTQKHIRILSTVANLVASRIDRILADEKIKESEERFRFIAENTSDGIFVTEESLITYASPSCTKIMGYTFEEYQEISRTDLLNFVHPDDVPNFRTCINNVVKAKNNSFTYEYRAKHKDGYYIWREDTINIVYNEEGQPGKFIIVIRDTTEKVEKKQQLQQLLDVTSKQNERLMNFAHIVSHNIRSHSSNLSMIVNFMEETVVSKSVPDYFEMLQQSTEKLAETIENLNEIITIQNNINKPRMDLYLRDEIQKTLKALNTIILANEAVIINDVPEYYNVKGIASYMESIFLNLLTNALKYRAKDRKPVVHFSAKRKDDYLVLSIKDNGLGIDLKKHGHKIFGMYKTFHKNADARGIGLFITKNQIEAMGGRIEVESEVGVGTTFKIYLYMRN